MLLPKLMLLLPFLPADAFTPVYVLPGKNDVTIFYVPTFPVNYVLTLPHDVVTAILVTRRARKWLHRPQFTSTTSDRRHNFYQTQRTNRRTRDSKQELLVGVVEPFR